MSITARSGKWNSTHRVFLDLGNGTAIILPPAEAENLAAALTSAAERAKAENDPVETTP